MESRSFPANIEKAMTAQVHYKSVLDVCVMGVRDIEAIQNVITNPEEKRAFLLNRTYKKMLFSLFEHDLVIFRIKHKATIPLQNAEIVIDHTVSASTTDQNKYQFKIRVPQGKKNVQEHILGCGSEELRREWIFILNVLRDCEGKFNARKSIDYLNQQKKVSIWRESLSQSAPKKRKSSAFSNSARQSGAPKGSLTTNLLSARSQSVESGPQARKSLYDEKTIQTMLR